MHAIVVGGGPAGLVAASTLARAGWSCTVLEAAPEWGGRARTQTVGGGLFNLGPHALYEGGAAGVTLRELGLDLPGGVPRATHLLLPGGRLARFPAGVGSLLATPALPWRAKLELAGFLGRLPRLDPARVEGTVDAWLQTFQQPATRELLAALVRLSTYVHAPAALPASLAVAQLALALQGVRYLHGGWARLVAALAEAAQAAGATLVPKRPVKALRVDAGAAVGVVTATETLVADAVVLAVGLRGARRLLGEHGAALPTPTPVRAACLDLALAASFRARAPFALGLCEPVYLSLHSAAAELGDAQVLHVARYLTPGASAPPALALEAQLEGVCDAVLPGWREHVLGRRFAPSLTVVEDLPRGGLASRPAVDAVPVGGVRLCGDWVGPAGWLLDASLASARSAARSLLAARTLAAT